MKRIDWSLVMRHEHSARSVVELMQIRKTPSGADDVLHHAPEAFKRIEVVTTVGREQMQPTLLLPVCQSRRELFRPVDATTVSNHDGLFPGVTQEGPHLMDIVAQPLRISMGDDLREDFRGAILDGADHAEQHTTGDAAPRAILHPRLAFEAFVAFDVALAQWPCREASALGFPPPAGAGKGKAPQDGVIVIQQNDLAPAGPVLQGGECERSPCQLSGFGSEPPRGTARADVVFFIPRGRSRGSAGRRSGGRRRWRVPDNSTENGRVPLACAAP